VAYDDEVVAKFGFAFWECPPMKALPTLKDEGNVSYHKPKHMKIRRQ
jgi:hypothetical protein